MKKPNKKLVLTLSSTAVAVAAIGGLVFAYFSSQTDPNSDSATVGTVSLKDVEIHLSDSETQTAPLLDTVVDTETGNLTNLNPGDIIPVEFAVENTGNKSIVSKTYVYLVFDNDGKGYAEYSNFVDCVSVLDSDNNPIDPESITSGMFKIGEDLFPAIRFEVLDYSGNDNYDVLNGTGENAEEEDGIDAISATHTFKIKFSLDANVHTQNESMKVKTFTKALQYRNTSDESLEELMDDSAFFLTK